MDNIFDLLPFIIAIIVFIFRLLSGNKENKPQEEPSSQPTATTFDDLLKQITKQISEANQPKKEENQDKSLQEQRLERQKAKAKKAAHEAQKAQEKLAMAFVEKGMTEEQRTKDHHFNPYKIQAATKNKFTTLLKDKENLKNAIILNEVLKPKYF